MGIMQNGVDITDEIAATAKRNGEIQRARYNNFEETKVYLIKAKASLQDIPPPWMDDCIYHAIQKIKEAQKILA